ncbi:MAG: hypothetical protein LBT23_10555 [Synergistaceae bacterium]|jgi:hypothetical protein|nr:hypothetical protein [Synergistaceae bacterium]
MIPLFTCDAIERFLREHLGKVEFLKPGGGEGNIKFFQMNLPQPGAQLLRPREEDEDGNETALRDTDDDMPLEDGGYTRNEARAIFPAVVIRPVKFTGGSETSFWGTLTVVLTFAAFDESDECAEGVKQILNIAERCRQFFERFRILESRYKLSLPLTYELYDESVRPFWFGEMVTEWNIPLQALEIGTEPGAYGKLE